MELYSMKDAAEKIGVHATYLGQLARQSGREFRIIGKTFVLDADDIKFLSSLVKRATSESDIGDDERLGTIEKVMIELATSIRRLEKGIISVHKMQVSMMKDLGIAEQKKVEDAKEER